MDSAASESTPVPQVIFRGKKRKTYRQRAEPADDDDERSRCADTPRPEGTPTASDTPGKAEVATPIQSEGAEDEEKGLSVAEVLRLRNARKARLGGVKFGAGSNYGSNDAAAAVANGFGDGLDDLSLMIREEENKALDIAAGVKKRFAPQTGMAAELVNKHMEEYIEAELAKRHNAVALSSNPAARSSNRGHQQQQQPATATTTAIATATVTAVPRPEQQNRALQGQLMEIDLGDEARSRNEALTERARRKLHGEAIEDDDEQQQQSGRPKKVRLGRDGKPWRSRNRRNSDDIKRDQLVEEILRESRLDVYEAPTPPPAAPGSGAEDDGAADDRIAEEFRREFMDAMAQRQQKRKKPTNAPSGSGSGGPGGGKGGAAADEDVLKGPKLGGSRNVRAAMRNLLLEKAKEAKGKTR
ncbi:hepatocellular carcinoma-associated antigen 59-domain-containing protein [Daldinia decipiens]|uniref:hepatocellular carcinoma-associated antigen 59-domain-containing protein n=1 Tax=Daldinia decipiens TaxID=326647 RepID=UPI0020C4A18C|nr:hepatocellular carcinoma-associated antigen 59-domain-containing protein [Daldinia decipiens]KAI1659890.1 hepatocellular carcinoma-associated antigen 59-domain-containing protein [Daldinia decipiens]